MNIQKFLLVVVFIGISGIKNVVAEEVKLQEGALIPSYLTERIDLIYTRDGCYSYKWGDYIENQCVDRDTALDQIQFFRRFQMMELRQWRSLK